MTPHSRNAGGRLLAPMALIMVLAGGCGSPAFTETGADAHLSRVEKKLRPDNPASTDLFRYGTGDSERIDATVTAGDTLYVYAYVSGPGVNQDVDLRVTNLVSLSGDVVEVSGTDGNDAFTFAAGRIHQISVNGVAYTFDARSIESVTFDGRAGSDTVVLNGSSSDDTAVLRPGSAKLTGPGYRAVATNVEDVTVKGQGGADVAYFFDSA